MQAVGVAADELGIPALELEGGLLEEDGRITTTELETGGLLEEEGVSTTTELDKGLFEEEGVSTTTELESGLIEEEGGRMIPMLEEDRGTIPPPLEDGVRITVELEERIMVPEEKGRTTPEDSGIPALDDRSIPMEELSGVTTDTGATTEMLIPSWLLILSRLAESAKSVKALMLSWRFSSVDRSALEPFPHWRRPRAITGMIQKPILRNISQNPEFYHQHVLNPLYMKIQ